MGSQFDQFADMLFSAASRVFGESAEIIYRAGPAEKPIQNVKGIFQNSSLMSGDGMTVADFISTYEIKVGNFPAPTKGDSLRIHGEIYKISEVQRDSAQVLKLMLQKDKRLKNAIKKN